MTYTDILERLTMNELQELMDYLQEEGSHEMLLKLVEQEIELRVYIN